jgi:KaiC/GvpD/RAD55 family RecA-like ATPase
MIAFNQIVSFYRDNLPGAEIKGAWLTAACPFCARQFDPAAAGKIGRIVVAIHPDNFFRGLFRCTHNCVAAGFHRYFARLLNINPTQIPGYDPDDEGYMARVNYPPRHLGGDIDQFCSLLGDDQLSYFTQLGISAATVKELKIGFNGRYLVFPYFQDTGFAYAARCCMPGREEESFWHGNEAFSAPEHRVFQVQNFDRCQNGALFVVEGEVNLLLLKELGYPAAAVPTAADLAAIPTDRLSRLEHIFLLVNNSPEARLAARDLAVRVGFKARILAWPTLVKRGQNLTHLAAEGIDALKKNLASMIKNSVSFSPFASAQKERRHLVDFIAKEKDRTLLGLSTGFAKFDRATEGLRGINIMGGPPKAGKSCFFMQISTQIAQQKTPVIYYDFENGRRKIYLRTLVRISGLAEKKIRQSRLEEHENSALRQAWSELETMLRHFRVVTERQLTPDLMRRHIDFLKHETQKEDLLIVIDSLHKLPFKDLSERRTGIDSWLRQLEAIRDEQQVCFLVISELSRGKGGGYGERPDISSFKESGDIEYSADNALILTPNWDPLAPISVEQRKSILWMVASRESSPGQVAEYALDYPFWRFNEM